MLKLNMRPDLQKPDIIAHFVFREIPIFKIQYAVTILDASVHGRQIHCIS